MELTFVASEAQLQMGFGTSEGEIFRLLLSVALRPASSTIRFPGGSTLYESLCSLSLQPLSSSRFANTAEIGQMMWAVGAGAGPARLVVIEVAIPDSQFNVVLSEMSRSQLPELFVIDVARVGDSESDSLQSEPWDGRDRLLVRSILVNSIHCKRMV